MKKRAQLVDGLVRDHEAFVLRLARQYVRHGSDAQDVAGVVWLNVWRAADTIDEKQNLRNWLHTITRNAANDLLRQRRGARTREVEATTLVLDSAEREPPLVPCQATPEQEIWAQRFAEAFERALTALKPDERAVILLRWNDLSFSDIALELGMPKATVASHMTRGRSDLAALLAKQGYEFPGLFEHRRTA